MTDWEIFCNDIPWFIDSGTKTSIISESQNLDISSGIQKNLPKLAKLLTSASVTKISINNVEHNLLSWDSASNSRLGWLCFAPSLNVQEGIVYNLHAELLLNFGASLNVLMNQKIHGF